MLTSFTSFIGVMAAIPVSMAVVTPMVQSQLAGAEAVFHHNIPTIAEGSGSAGQDTRKEGAMTGARS